MEYIITEYESSFVKRSVETHSDADEGENIFNTMWYYLLTRHMQDRQWTELQRSQLFIISIWTSNLLVLYVHAVRHPAAARQHPYHVRVQVVTDIAWNEGFVLQVKYISLSRSAAINKYYCCEETAGV